MEQRWILGVRIDATTYQQVTRRVVDWARSGESRHICLSNVYTIMQARDCSHFRAAVNSADVVTPDGMPLVWGLRALGAPATRVYGPDLTWAVLEEAARERVPVGFYGGSPQVVADLIARIGGRMPGIQIAYACAPPFRPQSAEEDKETMRQINAAGVRILFVGLGCPKQELWMAEHRERVRAVMLGVGAAFDFLSGAKRQAPRWMQQAGLEWAFRLACEPRRLWRRYLIQNPRFATLFTLELLGLRRPVL